MAVHCDSHVRFDERAHTIGNLGVGVICRRLVATSRAPVTNIGCNSDNNAPRTAGDPGLIRLPTAPFSRPVFAGKAFAHNCHWRRTCRIPFIERAALKHRDFKRAEIIFAYSPVSGDDFSLYRSWRFAFGVNRSGGIGAGKRKITCDCCRFHTW